MASFALEFLDFLYLALEFWNQICEKNNDSIIWTSHCRNTIFWCPKLYNEAGCLFLYFVFAKVVGFEKTEADTQ